MRLLALDRESSTPLIRQIYYQISDQILRGELRAGERLPSTRETASELSVSRNVVMEAYEQLAAEGFLLGISGAGTYVAEGSRIERSREAAAREAAESLAPRPWLAPSRDEDEGSRPEPSLPEGLIDFELGRPALDLVPTRAWARIEQEERLGAPETALSSAPAEGLSALREELKAYLWRRRGIDCAASRIIVTSGAVNALGILADVLLKPGESVIVEDPGHLASRKALADRGAAILGAPVDREGIAVDLLPCQRGSLRCRGPALALATPSHQFPLGGCLSIQRRITLVEWAIAEGALIAEDDYESEFRYDVGPVASMHRLAPANVAYIGTFSKIFFPGLRLGYIVVPERLAEAYAERKTLVDRYSAPGPQLAMARFMREGRLDRHIAHARKAYRQRRDALAAALEAAFPGRVEILGLPTGLHVVADIEGADFGSSSARFASVGVAVYPVERYAIERGRHASKVALGYSHLTVAEIEEGVARLARALRAR